MLGVLAAEYYPGGRRGDATLDLNRIADGFRTRVISFHVKSKREARELAKRYDAKPWNF